jgi:predicted kinase
MAKLVVLRGLPAAGKSLYAARLVQQGYKRVSLDDLRLSVDNGFYSKQNEVYIVDVAQTMIALALQSGFNVVCDAYNLNPYHIKYAKAICRDTRSELEVVDIDTPLEVCLQRDLERTSGRVGKDVIMKLYDKYFIDGKFPKADI